MTPKMPNPHLMHNPSETPKIFQTPWLIHVMTTLESIAIQETGHLEPALHLIEAYTKDHDGPKLIQSMQEILDIHLAEQLTSEVLRIAPEHIPHLAEIVGHTLSLSQEEKRHLTTASIKATYVKKIQDNLK